MEQIRPLKDESFASRMPGLGPLSLLVTLLLFGLVVLVAVSAAPQIHPSAHVGSAGLPSQLFANVKDYGAKGNGVTDDTAAINRAIQHNIGDSQSRFLFFPAGVYLVSDSLEWRDTAGAWQPYLGIQGDSEGTTIIRLKNKAPGYSDPDDPKAVLYTASGLLTGDATAGGKDYDALGEGGEAFRNFIFDLTVDTGAGNPGAVGIDFLGNNVASIRDVTVRSGDGAGSAGISMTRKWVGPALLKDVTVNGFDYGISVANTEYSITIDGLSLQGQHKAGIRNDGNVLSLQSVKSDNFVPAIYNSDADGLVVVLDGDFSGGAPYSSAIENVAGELYARNLTAEGYQSAIESKGSVVAGSSVSEFVSQKAETLFSSASKSLQLDVKDAPDVPRDAWQDWVNVEKYGATGAASAEHDPDHDDTAAVQAAIDSGASTIYFPPGRYLLSDTVHIRGNVGTVYFSGALIGEASTNSFADGRPLFQVDDGKADTVLIDQLGGHWSPDAKAAPVTMIEDDSTRALVIRDSIFDGYRNKAGSGPLFVEDVVATPWRIDGQDVWARQLNMEGDEMPMALNDGGKLWILGLKTERASTVIQTDNGGRTEVLGGLLYPAGPVSADTAAFVNNRSSQSLVYAVSAFAAQNNYALQLRSTRDGGSQSLQRMDVPSRGSQGSIVPLATDYR